MTRVSVEVDDDGSLVLLGKAIRDARKARKLSQEAFADAAGIERSHMGRIERGQSNITLLNVARIAKFIGCKPSELMASAGI